LHGLAAARKTGGEKSLAAFPHIVEFSAMAGAGDQRVLKQTHGDYSTVEREA